jgi:hypothetical protein
METETIDHLFIHCYVTSRFWNRFMQWIGYDTCMPKTVLLLLQEYNHLLYGKILAQSHLYALLWYLVVYLDYL